ncbi:hypothetical protein [Dactylosporangium sp. NPDC049140]|uniref:hypothetical protein n=1 Tax=Dactylosporangium sp. NPDC049140 TaxID=3155647 RepID=UPI0033D64B20
MRDYVPHRQMLRRAVEVGVGDVPAAARIGVYVEMVVFEPPVSWPLRDPVPEQEPRERAEDGPGQQSAVDAGAE